MDLNTILSSTLISGIISALVIYINSKREERLKYITGDRREWREKMREIASKLHGATYDDTLKVLTELKVRINPYGKDKEDRTCFQDAHIWKLIGEIEKTKINDCMLCKKQQQMIDYISLLLKYDWERSNGEVRGNLYEVINWVIMFFNITYLCYLGRCLVYSIFGYVENFYMIEYIIIIIFVIIYIFFNNMLSEKMIDNIEMLLVIWLFICFCLIIFDIRVGLLINETILKIPSIFLVVIYTNVLIFKYNFFKQKIREKANYIKAINTVKK